ncbi:MAG: hypothetical protein IJU19_01775 [Bacteroidales bacterium]|nr:hypothetical protein [Bacteroidales bacterium]
MNNQKLQRILVLASGGGGTYKFLHKAIRLLGLPYTIVAAVCDRECGAAEYARKEDIPLHLFPDWRSQEADIISTLRQIAPDIILSTVHRILTPNVLSATPATYVNIHFSLLPSFAGLIGMDRIFALARQQNVRVIGATAHYITEELDGGPIIAQGALCVDWTDDIATIKNALFRVSCLTILNALLTACPPDNPPMRYANDGSALYSPHLPIDKQLFTEQFWLNVKNA